MDEHFLILQNIFKSLLLEEELKNQACELARFLHPSISIQSAHIAANVSCHLAEQSHVCRSVWEGTAHQNASPSDGLNPDVGAHSSKATNETFPRLCHSDIVLLQMTLVEMMSYKAQNHHVDITVKQQYVDILALLYKMGILSKLLNLYGNPEKLLSHTAAKCVTSLVLFHMRNNVLNCTWLKMCLKTLSEDAFGSQTAECLWSIATVIKGVLKDHCLRQSGILLKLFAHLDRVLEGYYILSLSFGWHDKSEAVVCGSRNESNITSSLTSLIDLLEVLVASRVHLHSDFLCQRLVYLHTIYALQLLTSSAHYVAKKKIILLLKKCLIWKAGEDLVNTPVPSGPDSDSCLSDDTLALAKTVLSTATPDWLSHITIGENVQFGGSTMLVKDDAEVGPDMVFIRALSLTLLKALEVNAVHSATEMEGKDLCAFLSQLMMLLRRHLKSPAQVKQLLHPCAWITLVFMEQDDDMVEAAKALLTIYLHHGRLRINSDSIHKKKWTPVDHELGCNPHCVFLSLLNSIAFDHAVLLDYLISTETCFLEYLVKYLKLLQTDCQHFIRTCKLCQTAYALHVPSVTSKEAVDSNFNSDSKTVGSNLKGSAKALFSSSYALEIKKHPDDCQTVAPDTSLCSFSSGSIYQILPAARSLVDYDISDDSEPELSEASVAQVKQPCFIPLDSTVLKEHELTFFMDAKKELHLIQNSKITNMEDCDSSVYCRADEDLSNTEKSEELHIRTFKCLRDLQNAIARLHCKKLFPYNPAALLKLLRNVESLSEVC